MHHLVLGAQTQTQAYDADRFPGVELVRGGLMCGGELHSLLLLHVLVSFLA